MFFSTYIFTKCIETFFFYILNPTVIFVKSLSEQGETQVTQSNLVSMLDFTEFETFWSLTVVIILMIYQLCNLFLKFRSATETALL